MNDAGVAFDREMRARRNLVMLLGLLAGAAVLVWKLSRVFGEHAPGETPPGIVIDVDASGAATVEGCALGLARCIETARENERHRPGGAREKAAIRAARDAPREAIQHVRGLLLQHDFIPFE